MSEKFDFLEAEAKFAVLREEQRATFPRPSREDKMEFSAWGSASLLVLATLSATTKNMPSSVFCILDPGWTRQVQNFACLKLVDGRWRIASGSIETIDETHLDARLSVLEGIRRFSVFINDDFGVLVDILGRYSSGDFGQLPEAMTFLTDDVVARSLSNGPALARNLQIDDHKSFAQALGSEIERRGSDIDTYVTDATRRYVEQAAASGSRYHEDEETLRATAVTGGDEYFLEALRLGAKIVPRRKSRHEDVRAPLTLLSCRHHRASTFEAACAALGPDERNDIGQSALHVICSHHHIDDDVMSKLDVALAAGIEPAAKDDRGGTAVGYLREMLDSCRRGEKDRITRLETMIARLGGAD